jgi:hypothetical protein
VLLTVHHIEVDSCQLSIWILHFSFCFAGMAISCVFILATVAVYAWLPELRNLHGKVLVSYLLCLFVGFSFLTAMQILLVVDNISSTTCVGFSKYLFHHFYLEPLNIYQDFLFYFIWRCRFEGLDGAAVSALRRAIAEVKQRWSVIGCVTKNLLSRAPPCFGRHVKPLVPAAFADVSTH